MVSSISSTPPRPPLSASPSGQQTEAALRRQIAAKEAEIQATTNKAQAARLAEEVAALKTRLEILQQKKETARTGGGPAQR
ncbi:MULTISPECIES: hypothetical protein [Phyllobacteriaceae]|jgi:hypothetical protein|uniref:Uncharacterized protein n=1 Tax=Mesorhizobium hungaricum TaxID=1566387 RepID=A0A1C2DI97_9HYPH|nr:MULTISPECIES: hypothetical protein [Mesorhizobium]MBN9234426.1 hypothetical protein [Mesorhizobium sp.]MDQ0332492.1 regulator of protease activity HflC (stomatin/prohibitin superfamily) [Mesorhizobium sp. YL-MeA3-2017]OCX14494.1 hypothetical protein QV13_18675 [Mesorhizobium hungaricum]